MLIARQFRRSLSTTTALLDTWIHNKSSTRSLLIRFRGWQDQRCKRHTRTSICNVQYAKWQVHELDNNYSTLDAKTYNTCTLRVYWIRTQATSHTICNVILAPQQVQSIWSLARKKTEIPELQVDPDAILKEIRLPYHISHLLILLLLAAIPTLFLNLTVGILAGIYSERRREKALAKSKAKIRGFDVMLTEKVMFCIVAIPTIWFFYGILMYFFTDFDGPTMALCIMSMPLFANIGILLWEKLVWLISRVLGLTTCACSLHLGVGWSTPLKREESCKPMSRRASSVTLSSLADANEGAKKDK